MTIMQKRFQAGFSVVELMIAMLLSMAMMLRHSLDRAAEAEAVERAVHACWKDGILTRDLRPDGRTTAEVTEAVCERLRGPSALAAES